MCGHIQRLHKKSLEALAAIAAALTKEPRREGRALPVAYLALVPYTHKPYGDAGESFRGLTMLRTGAGPVTTRSAPRPEGTKSSTVTVARHDK